MLLAAFGVFITLLIGYFLREDMRCEDCNRVRLSTHNVGGNMFSVCADCAMKRNLKK